LVRDLCALRVEFLRSERRGSSAYSILQGSAAVSVPTRLHIYEQ